MRKTVKNKLLISFLIIFCFITMLGIKSKAVQIGMGDDIPSVRKYFTVDKTQLADVTLTIVGSAKIDSNQVSLYEVDSKGSNPRKVQFSSSITTNNKNHIYTLSHSQLLKGKEHYFNIQIKDTNGNISESRFNIYTKTKDGKTYYEIDDSPRIIQWVANRDYIYILLKDLEGIKSLKIQDLNNNNSEINFSDLAKGENVIKISTNKIKINQNKYNLKIIATENDSNYAQQTVNTVNFQLLSENAEILPQSIKLNKSSLSLDKEYNTTAQLIANIEPKLVTSKDTITWKSSNSNIATVSSNGTIKAKNVGTVNITATTQNGKSATCKLTVKALSNEKINITLNKSDFKKVLSIKPTNSNCKSSQSFCITDKYYVCALININTNNQTVLQIYDRKTGKLVNTITDNFHHANGMTYNSKDKNIYIAHNDGAKYSKISSKNIDTIKTLNKSTKTLSKQVSGIAYDSYTGDYYTGSGSKIHIYDGNLKYQRTYTKSITNTPQDIGAYRGLILVINYINEGNNALDIYRASNGKYLGRYKVNLPGELESIDYDEESKQFVLYVKDNGSEASIYTTKEINLDKYCL